MPLGIISRTVKREKCEMKREYTTMNANSLGGRV
jgi:hypothetical protein